MRKPFVLAAALALCLTACGKSPADTASISAPPAQEIAASGEVHLLSAASGGFYYKSFLDGEIEHSTASDRALVYSIDETAGTARPACKVPDCQHDSAACPAYGGGSCYADGDHVYVYTYHYDTDRQKGCFALEVINADRTARAILADDLPESWALVAGLAADDTTLYLFVNYYTKSTPCSALLAIDRSGDGSEIIYQWDGNSDVSLIGAADHYLYFAIPDADASTTSAAYTTGALDLTARTYTEQHRYEGDFFCLQDGSYGLVEQNTADGSLCEIDPVTGECIPIAANLPTASDGNKIDYILSHYSDGWILHTTESPCDGTTTAEGSSTVRNYFCQNGTATELPQRRFIYGKEDAQGLSYCDIQNGRVLAIYQESTGTVQDITKDGTAVSQTAAWSTCGLLPLDDLLSGSSDFMPLQFSS